MATDAPSTTTQLRRYTIAPGRMADHVAWFPTIRKAREHHGFRVAFAVADYEKDVFTWAVAIDGPMEAFLEVQAGYDASPERAAAFETNPHVVTDLDLSFVTDALL